MSGDGERRLSQVESSPEPPARNQMPYRARYGIDFRGDPEEAALGSEQCLRTPFRVSSDLNFKSCF